MKTRTSQNFTAQLATGISDGCLILVCIATSFIAYQVFLASAVGY
jgi:hypothetical protein